MRDAAHPAERKDERQHGNVAYDRGDEQKNVDADERRRLDVAIGVQTVTVAGDDLFHQPPIGVIHDAGRRLFSAVSDRCQTI